MVMDSVGHTWQGGILEFETRNSTAQEDADDRWLVKQAMKAGIIT
eukprot:CAMPEP_0171074882 /NCGR_PEP_ID=MMETSP0766_2-20121228/12434_1 /TAXON_ID=439317 /ORGANISM="Gambierdiscus australes, Strain CAWD 149" /LENGTH=44 /DNA_ID= /DNA_START= /DNA_END= /DNA_ORIENTATION=